MAEANQPLRINSGKGGWKEKGLMMVKEEYEEESPPLNLGLGISSNHVIKHKKRVFTPAQLCELQQQVLIYKYLAEGIPVPPQLVVPIWRSVALSLGAVVSFNPRWFNYRELIEPEPGRCRRTDGKKWRCSKNVIPNRKYCEQHIHRGRHRSKKPEEPPQVAKERTFLPSDAKKPEEPPQIAKERTSALNDAKRSEEPTQIAKERNFLLNDAKRPEEPPQMAKERTFLLNDAKRPEEPTQMAKERTFLLNDAKRLEESTQIAKQRIFLPNEAKKRVEEVPQVAKQRTFLLDESKKPVETSWSARSERIPSSDSKKDVEMSMKCNVSDPVNLQLAIPTPAIIRTSSETAIPTAIACKSIGRDVNSVSTMAVATISNIERINESRNRAYIYGKAKVEGIVRHRSYKFDNIAARRRMYPGLGFSPKSVLQVYGCTVVYKNKELEPGRCKRTDGKKWRCRKEVVPDQKYCVRHMHRGVKKAGVAASSSSAVESRLPKNEDGPELSTKLSIAVPSPYLVRCGENGASSSCSSDATISDTSITSA